MTDPVFYITEAELQKESEALLDRVYRVLQRYDFDPPDWGGSIFSNSDYRDLFAALDSKFFRDPYKEGRCVFRQRAMIGREFNYYFQGLVFAAFGYSKTYMRAVIRIWKAHYVVTSELAVHLASDNDLFMANLGYDDFPARWSAYVASVQEWIKGHPRQSEYKPYAPPSSAAREQRVKEKMETMYSAKFK